MSAAHDPALDAEADALRLAYLSLDAHAALPWADVVPRVQARWRRVALHVRSRFAVTPTNEGPDAPRFSVRYVVDLDEPEGVAPGVYDSETGRYAPFSGGFPLDLLQEVVDRLRDGDDSTRGYCWTEPGLFTMTSAPEGAPNALPSL